MIPVRVSLGQLDRPLWAGEWPAVPAEGHTFELRSPPPEGEPTRFTCTYYRIIEIRWSVWGDHHSLAGLVVIVEGPI